MEHLATNKQQPFENSVALASILTLQSAFAEMKYSLADATFCLHYFSVYMYVCVCVCVCVCMCVCVHMCVCVCVALALLRERC